MATKQVENRDFLDFTDFFRLLKDSMTSSHSNEDVFIELVSVIYEEAGVSLVSPKDDVSDICRKKKAFNPQVRNVADNYILDKVMDAIKAPLIEWIIQLDNFVDKLLFLIKKDSVFFTDRDYRHLEEQRNDPAYIIAFVLIRTIACSDKTSKLIHPDNYNPFANYSIAAQFETAKNDTLTQNILVATSKYIFDQQTAARCSMPPFVSELLSNGITYNTYRNDFNFQQSFSITTEAETQKSLSDYLNRDKNLLILGEGGIGKTTFLYSCLKKYHEEHSYHSIPIYIKLSECSTNTDHRYMILNEIYKTISFATNGTPIGSFKDILDEFCKPRPSGEAPEYTLLLDGFNEITAIDYGEIRHSIATEISGFLSYPNLRIILTSRDVDFCGLSLIDFEIVRANGIINDEVINYLHTIYGPERVKEICENSELMQYLKIPLFLLMYSYGQFSDVTLPQNRGAILFNYFNSTRSFYNEKKNIANKSDIKTYLLVNVLLDFLLPDIGFYMMTHDCFHITEDTLDYLIRASIKASERFIGLNATAYSHYEQYSNTLRRVLTAFSKLEIDDILILLRDCLCVINCDAGGRIYFAHQYIRDYFSALYCIKEMYYLNTLSLHHYKDFSRINYVWGDTYWNKEQLDLIQEILTCPSDYQTNDLIYETIKLFKKNISSPLPMSRYGMTNLINVLVRMNNSDLSKYDFSYLDLSSCNLTNINFYNPVSQQSARFDNATFSKDTFTSDAHYHEIMDWSLSDDERFIISMATDQEIKVWNIATQKCLMTRKPSYRYKVDFVNSLELYVNGTLAVFSYLNYDDTYTIATYDFTLDIYTIYILPDCSFQLLNFWGYNKHSKKLMAILSDGTTYKYNLHEAQPVSFIHLAFNDNTVLDTKEVFKNPKEICTQVRKIYALADNNIMCAEANENKRLVKYNIYNLDTASVHNLVLNITPARMSSLFPNSKECNELLLKHTTVSKDGKCIAIHDLENIYTYNLVDMDYTFKPTCKLPPGNSGMLKFCHEDSQILTVGQYRLHQININTGEILWESNLTGVWHVIEKEYSLTSNYRIGQEYDYERANGRLKITNIYTMHSDLLCLSNAESMMNVYLSSANKKLYALFDNCTLISMMTNDMQLTGSYNYSPNRQLLAHTYFEEKNLLCFSSISKHSDIHSSKCILTLINLNTGEHLCTATEFNNILNILFTANAEYIVAFTEDELLLLDTAKLSLISEEKAFYNAGGPAYAWTNEKLIHIVYSYKMDTNNKTYYGMEFVYEIDTNNNFSVIEIKYMSSFKMTDNTPPIIYKSLDTSGLFIFKTIERCDDLYVSNELLKYSTDDEYPFRMRYDTIEDKKNISDWNLAYLHTENGIWEYSSENNITIATPNFKPHCRNLVYKNNLLYVYYEDTQTFVELDSDYFKTKKILCYCEHENAIYYTHNNYGAIYKYCMDNQHTITSSHLFPQDVLIYRCDIDSWKGDLS